MKVKIHPTIVFRTPRFSYLAELTDCWEDLKSAIAISSSDFYETIKDVSASELSALPPKIYFTVWKYFNRAKFRSTPYGTFASFSILKDAFSTDVKPVVISQEQQLTSLVDWPLKNDINFDFNQLIANNCLLFSNSSFYLLPDTLRYIACTNGLFELAEIEQDDFVLQILDACLAPLRVNDLADQLGLDETGTAGLHDLLREMHELQLIFTNYDANIIGEDYFNRIGLKREAVSPAYIIAERNARGSISAQDLQTIPEAIAFLQGILPSGEREALKLFIAKFVKKFEGKEVPLMQALDPEIGVGYDELEHAGNGDDLITQLSIRKQKTLDGRDVKALISQKISTQQFEDGETIFLDKLSVQPREKGNPLPNSISMLLRLADGLIFADQIGGPTANALSGRFTMASDTVDTYCKQISAIEQNANPDVLFFDVAYMVEATVDNINRRKLVYQHQLSILNFDTSAEPLSLNDIQISIINSEIVLRSKSLNKRIVPKMASAYNYTRSDLSVFRMLCDLQHHHAQTSLSLPLDGLFPELDNYPRLQYQNVVLSARKWKLNKRDFYQDKQPVAVEQCRIYLKNRNVTACFKTGLSDQTLCFQVDRDEDLTAFLQYVQKQESFYIEEVVLPGAGAVIDEHGKPYLAQFVLGLYHQEKIYRGIIQPDSFLEVKESFPPGEEWLYFEIFCHQQRTDQVLAETIAPFVDQYADHIKSWFFIRYNEGGNHIRFRILLNDLQDSQLLTAAFVGGLNIYLSCGLVSDIQIKTYKREIARYGAQLIVAVEDHFNIDSEYVLSLFETAPEPFDKYRYCLNLIAIIKTAIDFDGKDFIILAKLISDVFNEEHELDASDFKKLNSQYQLFKNASPQVFNDEQQAKFTAFAQSFVKVLGQCPSQKRFKLFSDLMHMHVNRLFNKDQRVYEMVMYYFLLKELQRQKAMNN
ncbi:thiopeptide-type bacteriocin biosynthesis protein [Pedobacter frigidisoli]|uniref:lantibiotic dehydratase n=1 Tax=Pedobacter frigidisoli TaxID=2530455 RepID=UPI00292D7FCB|nr:thiopeptide-type bacteriocin biosynthesis protein [Pedobacter frigidisoli]